MRIVFHVFSWSTSTKNHSQRTIYWLYNLFGAVCNCVLLVLLLQFFFLSSPARQTHNQIFVEKVKVKARSLDMYLDCIEFGFVYFAAACNKNCIQFSNVWFTMSAHMQIKLSNFNPNFGWMRDFSTVWNLWLWAFMRFQISYGICTSKEISDWYTFSQPVKTIGSCG